VTFSDDLNLIHAVYERMNIFKRAEDKQKKKPTYRQYEISDEHKTRNTEIVSNGEFLSGPH
jgi:hypothetical protein